MRPPAPPLEPHRCAAAAGSVNDVAQEPPLWRAVAGGRDWTTRGGCLVRIDVIGDYDGPRHCGFQSARYLVVGRPIGARFRNAREALQYVRDPENAFGDRRTASLLDLDAALPAAAVDSGLRMEGSELWYVPGDAGSIFIRSASHVERWPLDRVPTLCA